MTSKTTPEKLRGKYIVCFTLLSSGSPVLDCVRYSGGENDGEPYLYDSIETAKNDLYFDSEVDEVVTAVEFFEHLKKQKSAVKLTSKSHI